MEQDEVDISEHKPGILAGFTLVASVALVGMLIMALVPWLGATLLLFCFGPLFLLWFISSIT